MKARIDKDRYESFDLSLSLFLALIFDSIQHIIFNNRDIVTEEAY